MTGSQDSHCWCFNLCSRLKSCENVWPDSAGSAGGRGGNGNRSATTNIRRGIILVSVPADPPRLPYVASPASSTSTTALCDWLTVGNSAVALCEPPGALVLAGLEPLGYSGLSDLTLDTTWALLDTVLITAGNSWISAAVPQVVRSPSIRDPVPEQKYDEALRKWSGAAPCEWRGYSCGGSGGGESYAELQGVPSQIIEAAPQRDWVMLLDFTTVVCRQLGTWLLLWSFWLWYIHRHPGFADTFYNIFLRANMSPSVQVSILSKSVLNMLTW